MSASSSTPRSRRATRDCSRSPPQHCLTTRTCLVRGDGSTAHEGHFRHDTGEFLRQSTQQGWRDDSSWARGLAWALYGFATVYAYRRCAFPETAEACAHFYIEHTPAARRPAQRLG